MEIILERGLDFSFEKSFITAIKSKSQKNFRDTSQQVIN